VDALEIARLGDSRAPLRENTAKSGVRDCQGRSLSFKPQDVRRECEIGNEQADQADGLIQAIEAA